MVQADITTSETEPKTALQPEPILNVDEIQGNSLAGFNKDFQTLLFVNITSVNPAKEWLRHIEPHIATLAEVIQFNQLFKATRKRRGGREGTVRATFINIGFSFKGLKKLTNDADQFTDVAFKEGLATRSALLGDPTDPNAEGNPKNWLIGGSDNEPDLVLIVASDDKVRLNEEVAWIESSLNSGLEIIFKQSGETLPGDLAGHEHFGFKDGVSQPGMRGRLSETADDFLTLRENPNDSDQGKPGQDLLWAGEFVFGYPTQIPTPKPGKDGLNTDPGAIAVAGPEWAQNGSFLVFRRLRQDVKGFREFVQAAAPQLSATNSAFAGITPEKFGAKFVGRWASGAPILRATEDDIPAMANDECANNYFEFEDESEPLQPGKPDQCTDKFPNARSEGDAKGLVCPFAGHIRKAYPRDTERDFGLNESSTQTHRLLRRGIPFGQPFAASSDTSQDEFDVGAFFRQLIDFILSLLGLKPDEPAPDDSRGLLFLAYQTSIERQFEFVTGAWVNNPNFPDPNAGHDPILGQNGEAGANRVRTCVFQANHPENNAAISLPVDWVIPTGGGYFFTPSISALRHLAQST
ncbi:Dyp-type peroxidase [Phormidesmis priestleyi]